VIATQEKNMKISRKVFISLFLKDDREEKISILMLRQLHEKTSKMIEEAQQNGNEEEAQRQKSLLKQIDEKLNNMNDERRFVKFGIKSKSDLQVLTELSINN
jgi:uncharacterized protein YpiB (UPF0302 family)